MKDPLRAAMGGRPWAMFGGGLRSFLGRVKYGRGRMGWRSAAMVAASDSLPSTLVTETVSVSQAWLWDGSAHTSQRRSHALGRYQVSRAWRKGKGAGKHGAAAAWRGGHRASAAGRHGGQDTAGQEGHDGGLGRGEHDGLAIVPCASGGCMKS